MKLSVIIPVFNEAEGIENFLKNLQWLRGKGCEVIIVDGGSQDNTLDYVDGLCDKALNSATGRSAQMNTAAAVAEGEILLFLHADTILPLHATEKIMASLLPPQNCWGRFDVKLSGQSRLFALIAYMMNLRSRLSGIATGDQAIFVRADVFAQIGGYDNIPLMEDISLSKQLKKISKPVCLREKVITSSRRWEQHGPWKTIFLMWRLRLAYFFGKDPALLVAKYSR